MQSYSIVMTIMGYNRVVQGELVKPGTGNRETGNGKWKCNRLCWTLVSSVLVAVQQLYSLLSYWLCMRWHWFSRILMSGKRHALLSQSPRSYTLQYCIASKTVYAKLCCASLLTWGVMRINATKWCGYNQNFTEHTKFYWTHELWIYYSLA